IGSGGSTRPPKLIVAEQGASFEAVEGLVPLLRVPAEAGGGSPGPLSPNAPFSTLSGAPLIGNHVALLPRLAAAGGLPPVADLRARWLYQVPTMMLRIWRHPERESFDVSSLDLVFHMAAPCPPWLKEEWCAWLGPETILELYAGTELQAMTILDGRQ